MKACSSMTCLNSIYICLFHYCKGCTLFGIFAKKKKIDKRKVLIINRAIWCSAANQVLIPQHWSCKFSCLQLQLLLWSFAYYHCRYLWKQRNSHEHLWSANLYLSTTFFFSWNWHQKGVIATYVLSYTFSYGIIIRLSCLERGLPLEKKHYKQLWT